MKTESEIKSMFEHCVKSDGQVSPSVLQALQWVLGFATDRDCDTLFNLDLFDNTTGEWK